MIDAKNFDGLRTRNMDLVVKLANELCVCDEPFRSSDPTCNWEKHPIIKQYMESLKDREIAAACDVANKSRVIYYKDYFTEA